MLSALRDGGLPLCHELRLGGLGFQDLPAQLAVLGLQQPDVPLDHLAVSRRLRRGEPLA